MWLCLRYSDSSCCSFWSVCPLPFCRLLPAEVFAWLLFKYLEWFGLMNWNTHIHVHTHTHTFSLSLKSRLLQSHTSHTFFSRHAGLGVPVPGYKRIPADPEELPCLVSSTPPEVLGTVVRDKVSEASEVSEDQKREAGPSWDRIASCRRPQAAQGQAWRPMRVFSTCRRTDLSIALPLLPISINAYLWHVLNWINF